MCPPYMLFTRLFRITFKEHDFRSTVYKYEGLIFTVTMARGKQQWFEQKHCWIKGVFKKNTYNCLQFLLCNIILLLLVYVEKKCLMEIQKYEILRI